MRNAVRTIIAGLLLAAGGCGSASATLVTDPVGDFIPSFGGAKAGDIDVLSRFATFDGTNFHIGGT